MRYVVQHPSRSGVLAAEVGGPAPTARRGEWANSFSNTREQFTLSKESSITSAVLYGAEKDNLNGQRNRGVTGGVAVSSTHSGVSVTMKLY